MSSFIGPGAYDVNYSAVEVRRGCGLPKSKRFAQPKPETIQVDVNPNYEAIKRRAPGVVLKKDIPRNDKLKARDEVQEFIQLESAMNERLSKPDAFKFLK